MEGEIIEKDTKALVSTESFEPSLGVKTSFSNFSGMDSANDTRSEVLKTVTLGLVVYKMDSTIHWIMQKAISKFQTLLLSKRGSF